MIIKLKNTQQGEPEQDFIYEYNFKVCKENLILRYQIWTAEIRKVWHIGLPDYEICVLQTTDGRKKSFLSIGFY